VACRENYGWVGIAGSDASPQFVVTAVAVGRAGGFAVSGRIGQRKKNDRRRNRRAWPADRHTDPRIAKAIVRGFGGPHPGKPFEKPGQLRNRSTISAQDEDSIKAGKGHRAAREWIQG